MLVVLLMHRLADSVTTSGGSATATVVMAAARLLARESERVGSHAALEQLVFPAIAQISGDRNEAGFGPALTVHAVRTLLRTLEAVADAPDERGDVAVLPVGGALDRAAAGCRAADPSSLLRLARALREANQMAEAALNTAATSLPRSTTPEAPLPEVAGRLNPWPGPDAPPPTDPNRLAGLPQAEPRS